MRIKVGFDPTTTDLHLGHLVLLRKVQELAKEPGTEVAIVIGDFTASIGDPTGKDKTRPPLTLAEAQANGEWILSQLNFLPPNRSIHHNSHWFGRMKPEAFLRLIAQFTVAQTLERDNFRLRMAMGAPVHLHELTYPILQGYDSWYLGAHIEVGGTDQLFNMHMGREIQAMREMEPQEIITVPLLIGLDGTHKMSKSLGNHIALHENPKDIFGKLMSIPDELVDHYNELLAKLETLPEHPMDRKKAVAHEITRLVHNREEADAAMAHFERTVQNKELPDDIPEMVVLSPINVVDAVVAAGFATSRREAKQHVTSGAVKLNGAKVTDPSTNLTVDNQVMQVGKRRFVRLKTNGTSS